MKFYFQFCGVCLLALGIWGKVSDDNYMEEIVTSDKDALNATYVICMIVGIFLFLVGFLGCCGACMENRWMLIAVRGCPELSPFISIIHCAKLIPGHGNTYIRNRFSLGAPLNIRYIYNLYTKIFGRASPSISHRATVLHFTKAGWTWHATTFT